MDRSPRPAVLVIDDDPDISALFRELLEGEGFRVHTAHDGAHALAVLSGTEVDLIVTDLMMPVLDGFGFLRAYAQRPPPHAPVIATSALREYLAKALEAGAAEAYDKTMAFTVIPERARALLTGGPKPPPAPAPPEPRDESRRLQAILELQLDQPSPGEAMRQFTEQVARAFDMPVCLVSIVTHDRQHWTASCGLPADLAEARGTPRDHSFCTHAVVGRTALVVQDATENPYFATNPIVRERGLRFYAGVPVSTRTGEVVGTLCLLDFQPRVFTHFDLELLCVLAKRVMAEIDWRDRHLRPKAPLSAFRHLTSFDEELGILGREVFFDALRVQACRALERRDPLAVVVLVVRTAALATAVRALEATFPRSQCGRLGKCRLGVIAMGCTAGDAEALARGAAGEDALIGAAEVMPPAHAAEGRLEQIEASLGEAGMETGL